MDKKITSKLLGFGSFFCGINFFVMWCILLIIHTTRFGHKYEAFAVSVAFMAMLPIWTYIIFDTIHVVRNPIFSGKEKTRWIIILFGFHVIAFPVYWMKHQRQDHQTENKLVEGVKSADDAD